MWNLTLARQFSMEQSHSQISIIKEVLYFSGLFHIGIECSTLGGTENLAESNTMVEKTRGQIINECWATWALLSSLEWDTKICLPGGQARQWILRSYWKTGWRCWHDGTGHLKIRIKQDTDVSQIYDVETLSWSGIKGDAGKELETIIEDEVDEDE